MGIETVTAVKVSCQKCEATILVAQWQDAREHGWAVPCDGQLQLCPRCLLVQKGILMATAVPAGSLAAKLPGEQ